MAESSQAGSGPGAALLNPTAGIVSHLVRKYGRFLGQIIDCFIVVKDPFYPPYNFLLQQLNESKFCKGVKICHEPWQRALQLERANCRRCSPFGRLLIQSCSISGSQAEQLTTDVMDSLNPSSSDEDLMVVFGPVQWVSIDSKARRTTGIAGTAVTAGTTGTIGTTETTGTTGTSGTTGTIGTTGTTGTSGTTGTTGTAGTTETTGTTGTTGTTNNTETPRLTIAPTKHLGFVRVLQQRQPDCPHPETLPFPAEDVRQFCSELMLAGQPRAKLSVNGPAMSYVKPQISDVPLEQRQKFGVPEVDRVPCLHVPCWPSEEFFTRCRESGWPPVAAQEDMKLFGVHLVPVGAPGSVTERYEWRWSFSRAEVVTSIYLDTVPRGALKTVKACKKISSLQGKSLKSYYVKTAVFWLCQAKGGQPWDSVSQGVLQILDYLEKAMTNRRLSCFYWRDINILEMTKQEERMATLRTINDIRHNLRSQMIQSIWLLLIPLLSEPQPRLSERQMRVTVVRSLIMLGVNMNIASYCGFAVACRFDWIIPFAAMSSSAAEVCSMFRQFTTPWILRLCLLQALTMAPQDVASRLRLTGSGGAGFVWDVEPLMALLTEGDLEKVLTDPDAVRVWLRRQHRLPEAERPAGLPADLRTPRDLCDLLLNIPLLVSVLVQSVPSYRQAMLSLTERVCPIAYGTRRSFEAAMQIPLGDALGWFANGLDFHTQLGVDRELSLRRVRRYLMLLMPFCADPATRAEYDRLRDVMPDSWQLRQFVFGAAV